MIRKLLTFGVLMVALGSTRPWAQVSREDAVIGGSLPAPLPLFPAGNWWNQDITNAPIDSRSSQFISFVGITRTVHPDFGGYASSSSYDIYGFPFAVVG